MIGSAVGFTPARKSNRSSAVLASDRFSKPQVDSGRAGPGAFVAADATAGQMKGPRDLPGEIALERRRGADHNRPVLIDDALAAVAHRADLPAGVAFDAAGELGLPIGHPLFRRLVQECLDRGVASRSVGRRRRGQLRLADRHVGPRRQRGRRMSRISADAAGQRRRRPVRSR